MRVDPFEASEARYECFECGGRAVGTNPGTCPDCGGAVKNIAVSRE